MSNLRSCHLSVLPIRDGPLAGLPALIVALAQVVGVGMHDGHCEQSQPYVRSIRSQ